MNAHANTHVLEMQGESLHVFVWLSHDCGEKQDAWHLPPTAEQLLSLQ